MPQHAKGPRLYRRKDTGIYVIRDTGRSDKSTGTRDRREAEAALARYLAGRDRPRGPATPEGMTASEALVIYAEEHVPHVADPERIGYGIAALVPFWGDLPLSTITGETCRRYAKTRVRPGLRDFKTGEVLEWIPVSAGTIRKELGILQARYARKLVTRD